MDKQIYKAIIKKYHPKEDVLKNAFIAFFIGGLMGIIGQLLIDIYSYIFDISTKEAGTFMIVTLIFVGCFLTCLCFFDNFVKKCGCGLIVPITGFAHSMMSAALEYRKEGLVNGIGANMFKLAGSVIVFGVTSAYILGIIRVIL